MESLMNSVDEMFKIGMADTGCSEAAQSNYLRPSARGNMESLTESVDAMSKMGADIPENRDEQISWLKENEGNRAVSTTWLRIWNDLIQYEIEQFKPLFGGDADELMDKWLNCKVLNHNLSWDCPMIGKARAGVMVLATHAAIAGDFVFADYVLGVVGFGVDCFDEIALNMLIDAASKPGGETLKRWIKFTFFHCHYAYPRINEFLGRHPAGKSSQ